MRGVSKRSYGCATKAPPDERGGNRHAQPKATAPHSYSTHLRRLSNVLNRRTPDIADYKDLRRVRYFQILMVGLGLFPADRGGDGERALLTLTSRDRSSPTTLLWNFALDRADDGHESLRCGRRRATALGDETVV